MLLGLHDSVHRWQETIPGPRGNLAFHQYNLGSITELVDTAVEQQRDYRAFQDQGVSDDFLERIFLTPYEDLWYPTVEEMLAARVIHSVISPSDVVRVEQFVSIESLEAEVAQVPGFGVIKQYEPDTYQAILNSLVRKANEGATGVELKEAVAEVVRNMMSQLLPQAGDNALLKFTQATIEVLEKLRRQDPILCLKMLYPDQFGRVRSLSYLSAQDLNLQLSAMGEVVADAYERTPPPVDSTSVEKLMDDLIVRLGDEAAYLATEDLQNSEDYDRACSAVIRFYGIILTKDSRSAGNLLRYLYSQE